MRKTLLIASGTALILGLLGLTMVFGSALAQPIFQPKGSSTIVQEGDVASCHADSGEIGSAQDHMMGPLANALGMSEAELRAGLDAGNSIKDIAKARGSDDTKLAEALNGAMRDAMQQHVQDGLLSQSQVDEMLEHMDQMGPTHLTNMLDGQMSADMMRGMMDGQGREGMMGGQGHEGMMGGQGHEGMMGGQSHEGMMGGQQLESMMGGLRQQLGAMMGSIVGDTEDGSGGSCHTDDVPAGQQL